MDLARVIGTVVSTHKEASLEGVQLCILQPVDRAMKDSGSPLIASEAATARAKDDIVFYVSCGDAVHTHPDGRVMPVDAAIVGLVDRVDLAPPA